MDKSTTVRSFAKGLRPTRVAFALAAAIAPRLAARLGERLFLTPPHRRPPRREQEALARADEFALPFRGGRLRAWRFGEGPTVLLVHGWGGRGGQLASVASALVENGCSAVTFDGPAHGASSGRLASVTLFADAVAAMAERVGARAAVGHSLGAAATAVALRNGLDLRAAVLVAPPRGPAGFFERFCDAYDLPPDLRRAAKARIEERVGAAMENLDLSRTVDHRSTRLLVIHDRSDLEVPWTDGAAIAAAWPGAQLLSTEGLGHRRILRDETTLTQATAFVLEHLARCSCGRLVSNEVERRPICSGCALERELFDRSSRWVQEAPALERVDSPETGR